MMSKHQKDSKNNTLTPNSEQTVIVKNLQGRNQLHLAVLANQDIVPLLASLSKNIVNEEDCFKKTAFDYAVENYNKKHMAILASAGAQLDKLDQIGYAFIHHFVRKNEVDKAEYLLSLGADVQVLRKDLKKPLDLLENTLTEKNEKIWEVLLTYGAGIYADFKFKTLTAGQIDILKRITAGKFLLNATHLGKEITHQTQGFENAVLNLNELSIARNSKFQFKFSAFIIVISKHLNAITPDEIAQKNTIIETLQKLLVPSLQLLAIDVVLKHSLHAPPNATAPKIPEDVKENIKKRQNPPQYSPDTTKK